MKITRIKLLGAFACSLCCGSTLMAQNVGQWDFDSGNLSQTAGATLGDMTYFDGPSGQTISNTVFGSTSSLGIPIINGTNANVMKYASGSLDNAIGYLMPTPPGNGGGSLVNDYTVIFDILYTNSATFRPLIQMDDGTLDHISAYLEVNSQNQFQVTNTSGSALASGQFATIAANTWYRLAFILDTDNGVASFYTNGALAGRLNIGLGQLDSPYTLLPGYYLPVFSSTSTNVSGYVNSVQVRDEVLNPGQIEALGGPSAAGIPINLPPGHSFIASRSPDFGAVGAGPQPIIQAVIDQGSTTINPSSISMIFDGSVVSATVVAGNPNQYNVSYPITGTFLDPLSVHTVEILYTDSLQGSKTNMWSFTVANYQNITLPSPIYLETFDEVAEGGIPDGWTVTNWTDTLTPGLDLFDTQSDSYKDWVTISVNDYTNVYPDTDDYISPGFPEVAGNRRMMIPPIIENGVLLSSLADGNLMVAESDQRDGSQVQVMFTKDYNLTGYTNVYLSFHNIDEQNQDNICSVEYSTDQGATWQPLLYMLDDGTTSGDPSDVVTNSATGQIDVDATFNTARTDQAHGLSYGTYIGAAITTNLIPFIRPCRNDDPVQQKRIEEFRLPLADNAPAVRLRFMQAGTGSWYFDVDDVGFYSINVPVISSQPQSQTVDAGTTTTFAVASSGAPLTYQWKFNGNIIVGATNSTYIIASTSPTNAGLYSVVVSNASGTAKSSPAQLTVRTVPQIVTDISGEILDPGTTLSFTPTVTGGRPLNYLWYRNGNLIATTTSSTFSVDDFQAANAGSYQLVLNNSYGSVTGLVTSVRIYSGPITSNLVVHLPFDGNFNDTSGRGNNGSYATYGAGASPTPRFVPGLLGQAFEYSTTNDYSDIEYATLGYPQDLLFGDTNDWTVSLWCNYTNSSDDLPFISNKNWDSSSNPGWGIFSQGGGNYRINVTGPNGGADKFSETDTPQTTKDGNWHNIVVSFQRAPFGLSAYVYGYLDGVLVSKHPMSVALSIDTFGTPFSASQQVPPSQSTWAVNIGQDGTGIYTDNTSAHDIDAKIDDVGIWRRALTAHEAAGIYAAGLAGKDLSQAIAPSTLLISVSAGSAHLSWVASPTVKLQQSGSLNPANWTDVTGTLGASSATVPLTGSQAYFRLSQ